MLVKCIFFPPSIYILTKYFITYTQTQYEHRYGLMQPQINIYNVKVYLKLVNKYSWLSL